MLKKIEFVKSVFDKKDLPKDNLPEIVLCGRSNVGKSSFINLVFNRKNLAKTSSTPGKTRSINYYKVEDSFFIVDLPGTGYAKVSKEERARWNKIIRDYFSTVKKIKMAFHFIDSRHNPTDLDILLNDYLKNLLIPYIIILSKSDKLKQSELSNTRKEVIEFFPELVYGKNLLFFSAIKGTGKTEILHKLSDEMKINETFLL